jgi:hypothetical protein
VKVTPQEPVLDATAADAVTLERMGRLPPQPVPSARPDVPSRPTPADEAEEAALTAALADAGVTATAADEAAVQALTQLDAATVEAVTRWLKTKKDKPPDAPGK